MPKDGGKGGGDGVGDDDD